MLLFRRFLVFNKVDHGMCDFMFLQFSLFADYILYHRFADIVVGGDNTGWIGAGVATGSVA
ncbi:22681_t:CDS:2 [Dentiscutata erythropus]|uniref:22681_t:CDS:1 n=1 Tax=Dentiscutata erythropus TaxID=1348616 RepID=A0A9N9D0P2_9GLOM|nr:22681_t:CDS:2 [Dentiscutata erythropus]